MATQLRQDPLSGTWVIIAPQRAQRPHEVTPSRAPREQEAHVATCAFCPGNEAQTPPSLSVVPDPEAPQRWAVRVFPNKFAALCPSAPPAASAHPLFPSLPGVGHHEVIVDTPAHNGFLHCLAVDQLARLVRVWRDRYRALQGDGRIRHIVLFKNHGASAGASLAHPHTQLLALPLVPTAVAQQRARAQRYFRRHRRCLLCDLLRAEEAAGVRLLFADADYVAYHPFASSMPFEAWLVPRQHQADFGQLADAALGACARAVRRLVRLLAHALHDPDYNLVLYAAFTPHAEAAYHWHLRLLPRLVPLAGFELGSGAAINPVPPEEAAALVRQHGQSADNEEARA
ncbi:MAG: galactose-1-phosphate uridylyltransferase [Candidatus Tectimicrobiota bacterium]|nr:MAG: galactose-1-phosphate uridylyltransferase [Candidatus Tectomicrobia bacterium]